MNAKKLNKDILVDSGLRLISKIIKKGISWIAGLGISLSNNETKDIMKVIKFLENRGNLLKRTTRKITSKNY